MRGDAVPTCSYRGNAAVRVTTDLGSEAAFCAACGTKKAAGRCPRCDPTPRSPSPLVRTVALVLAVVLAGAVVAALVSLSAKLDTAQRDLQATRAELQALDERVAAAGVTANAASERAASLEAELRDEPKPDETAQRTQESVFQVQVGRGAASAWVAARSGGTATLVTNYHVVHEDWIAGVRDVELRRGDQSYPAQITAVREGADLALLTATVGAAALPRAAGEPSVGEPIMAVGAPLGLEGSVSSGIVSALRVEQGRRFIQFSAPIGPGSSGGPVVNLSGEVVGVTVLKAVGGGAEGLSFAIPIDEVCVDLLPC